MKIQVGIITVSDRAAAGQYDDLGGLLLREAADGYGWEVVSETVVSDDKEQIQRAIREQIAKGAHLVLTTGTMGTIMGTMGTIMGTMVTIMGTMAATIGKTSEKTVAFTARVPFTSI